MKKYICILCSLAIGIAGLTSCNRSGNNPFTAENAIKGQLGELYYVVPENAMLNDSTDELAWYKIPIDNSTEEYQLMISFTHTDDENEYESIIQNIDDMIKQIDMEDGIEVSTEKIDNFLGKSIDKGCKREGKYNGKKTVLVVVAESNNMYMVGYTVKTGFFYQSVWDNFYEQLRLV